MGPLLGASIKMVVRDRQSLFWALIFPLIFLGVFRLFSFDQTDRVELLLAADLALPRQQALAGALDDLDVFAVTVGPPLGPGEAEETLLAAEFDVVLILTEPAAGGPLAVELVNGIPDPVGSVITEAVITSVVDGVNASLSEVPRELLLGVRAAESHGTSYFDFLAPGIIGMGLMTFSVIGLAGSLSRYREEGVLRRIRATPLAPWKFSAAVVLSYLLVAVVQLALLVSVALALGADLATAALPGFVLVSLLGTLIFLNLGAIVAGRVRGRGAAESASNAITLPMMFLSGTFFPLSGLPEAVRWLVEVLPLTHMLRALRQMAIDGQPLWDQGPELAVLLGWALVTSWLARLTFRLDDV